MRECLTMSESAAKAGSAGEAKMVNAYGIFISITGTFIEGWREKLAKDEPSGHVADVVIEYNGKNVEFTFEEFLDHVGLRFDDENEVRKIE